jgi:protein involved in polysaccharide export with SLBB domain
VAPSWLVALAIAGLLAGCGPAVKNPSPREALPRAADPVTEYRIRPGDVLDIKFFYVPELNEQVTVRPDGRISLQLIPEVVAAGSTPADLTARLTEHFTPVLASPQLTTIVRSLAASVAYVGGQVANPQLVPLTPRTTVLQAVAQAGGFLDTARLTEVVLIRRGRDDRPVTVPLNLETALAGQDPGQDVTLVAEDIVYVPKSAIANVNQWVDQYIRKVLPMSSGFTFGYRLD